MNENTKQKNMFFAYIVMGIYLLFLSWLILFKLADSIDKIPSMKKWFRELQLKAELQKKEPR